MVDEDLKNDIHVNLTNKGYVFTCPKCGSHNVTIKKSKDSKTVVAYHIACSDCGYNNWTTSRGLREGWAMHYRPSNAKTGYEKKLAIKQRVVRTHAADHPRPQEGLVLALNAGWKVVMCHPIVNELEYIIEKEVEE